MLQYDELESVKEELKQKEKEIEEMQSVKLSQAFTDHSVTPESSMMNVGASFSEKVHIFMLRYIATDKVLFFVQKNADIFLICRQKHMLWVLIRSALPRRF